MSDNSYQKIILRYYRCNNFGDGINPKIFSFFTRKDIIGVHCNTDDQKGSNYPIILGIGSLLNAVDHCDIIYGTGTAQKYSHLKTPKKIICVRGPSTRRVLLENKIECPELYGDPALLLPFIFPPPQNISRMYKLGIIPHCIDKKNPILNRYQGHPDVLIIDIWSANNPEKFIQEISSCNNIISSSLHGIIIADAYNIPSGHIKFLGGVDGSFKIRDYYESVNREYYQINLNSEDIEAIVEQIKPYKCTIKLRELLEYFPYIDVEVKEMCLQKLDKGFLEYLQ